MLLSNPERPGVSIQCSILTPLNSKNCSKLKEFLLKKRACFIFLFFRDSGMSTFWYKNSSELKVFALISNAKQKQIYRFFGESIFENFSLNIEMGYSHIFHSTWENQLW